MQLVVPFGVCTRVCLDFVGCWLSSYRLVGWMSRPGLIGVVENVMLADLHPSIVTGFSGGFLLLTWRGVCVRFVHAFNATSPLSQPTIVESSCQAGPQCIS